MIKFFTGRSGSGKSCAIIEKIRDLIETSENNAVVIVPEQETVVWETKLAEILPESANLRLEVTNFTRLSNSVFREYGGLADSVIDEGARVLLIWRAMLSVWDSMRVYNNISSREDRSIPVLMKAIDELKSSGITPGEAEKALDLMRDEERLGLIDENNSQNNENPNSKKVNGTLSDRLADVVLVYSAYESLLHEEYIDRADLETKLAETLSQHPFFENKTIFIDSFLSFTMGQEKVIREIFETAADVYMTFMTTFGTQERSKIDKESSNNSDMLEDYEELQFTETTASLKRMITLANRVGKNYEIIPFKKNYRHENNEQLALIERYLFDYSFNEESNRLKDTNKDNDAQLKIDENVQNVQIVGCNNKYNEGEACSAIVASLLKKGYKYKDIAVVAHDISKYDGIVDSALRRHGFSCFISESSGIMRNPVIKFIKSSLAVLSKGWRRQDIICLIKTKLSAIDTKPEEDEDFAADFFEKYITLWDIKSKKMYTGDDWSMNPAGYKIGISEYGEKVLGIVNKARIKISDPLIELDEVFENRTPSVREIAESLVQYAKNVDVIKGLNRLGDAYRSLGMLTEAEKVESGWKITCEILDKIVEFLGDTTLDAIRFMGIFDKVAASMDVGTIPEGTDEIILGSAQGIRLDNKKCIIILGSNEGEFPGNNSVNKTFFADKDKEILEKYGMNFSEKDSNELASREFCMYYRSVSAASEELYVLLENDKELSEGARRIKFILPDSFRRFNEYKASDAIFDKLSLENYLLEKNYKNVKILSKKLLDTIQRNEEIDEIKQEESLDKANYLSSVKSKGNVLYLSQTKIDTYIRCPFNYACKYKLGIIPRAVGEITMPDLGVLVHRILQMFFEKNKSEKYSELLLDENKLNAELEKIIEECKKEIEKSVGERENRIEYLFIRLKRHILIFIKKILAETEESKFIPVSFEKKIGRGGIPSIEIETLEKNTVMLEGIVDRIDFYKADDKKIYVRIIDYKTGNKSFAEEKLDKGVGIQLLLYLFSLVKNGKMSYKDAGNFEIGGALYYSSDLKSINIKSAEEKDVLENKAISNIKVSGIYNEKFLTGEPEKGIYYHTESELMNIYKELEKIISKIGDEISGEKFDIKPMMIDKISPCDWCENVYICRNKD